ncbi:MAG: hypothetical protein ACYS26_15110 [Planctomycetota bacterium]
MARFVRLALLDGMPQFERSAKRLLLLGDDELVEWSIESVRPIAKAVAGSPLDGEPGGLPLSEEDALTVAWARLWRGCGAGPQMQ